jgi:3-hydroxybutyryl-CoA dehydrogenase
MGMEISDIKTICVVGAGTMGRRIALQCAIHNFKVNQWSRRMQTIFEAREWQRNTLYERVKKGSISPEEAEKILSRIKYTTNLKEAAENADFVFEAISEDIQTKREIFSQLDNICPNHTILATVSSSVKSSLIADATKRPDKVLNAHFTLAVEDNRLLEIMGSRWTSKETMETTIALGRALGMIVVCVKKEAVGLIFNRIWRAIKKAALDIVEMGIGTIEDVDTAWEAATGGEGPFKAMDKVGLDVILAIEWQWYRETKDPRDKPPKFLIEKVKKGELGVKTGKGFYTYPLGGAKHEDLT